MARFVQMGQRLAESGTTTVAHFFGLSQITDQPFEFFSSVVDEISEHLVCLQ
jgi:hypothetical protein